MTNAISKGGKPSEQVRRGDVALVGIVFLVAEVADPGFVLVDHHHALVLFCQSRG